MLGITTEVILRELKEISLFCHYLTRELAGQLKIKLMVSILLRMFAAGETSGERALRINLQKCLYYNIIVNKQNGERNNFYHGREFIGTTHNDIISYFKREDKIYAENIVRKVKEMDELNHGATKKISDNDFKKAEIGENLLATTTTAKSFGSPKITKQTIEVPRTLINVIKVNTLRGGNTPFFLIFVRWL